MDVERFCAPVVHPKTGETITSYRKLAKDQVAKETWTTGFRKEFGNLAQGDNKTGTPGMDDIRVMTLEETKNIPLTEWLLMQEWSWISEHRKKIQTLSELRRGET